MTLALIEMIGKFYNLTLGRITGKPLIFSVGLDNNNVYFSPTFGEYKNNKWLTLKVRNSLYRNIRGDITIDHQGIKFQTNITKFIVLRESIKEIFIDAQKRIVIKHANSDKITEQCIGTLDATDEQTSKILLAGIEAGYIKGANQSLNRTVQT